MANWMHQIEFISHNTLKQLYQDLSELRFTNLEFVQESSQILYLQSYYQQFQRVVGLKITKESLHSYEKLYKDHQLHYRFGNNKSSDESKRSGIIKVYDMLYLKQSQFCVVVQEAFMYSLEKEMQMLRQKNEWYSEDQMCSIIMQICNALCQIHKFQQVHLDIKPENIVKTSGGRYKVQNFGSSKLNLTRKEYTIYFLAFSYQYISPELAQKIEIDQSIKVTHKSDVYSLCLIILEILNYPLTKLNALNILLNDFTPSPGSSYTSLEETPQQKGFEYADIYELLCSKFFSHNPLKRGDSFELMYSLFPLLPLTSQNTKQLRAQIHEQNKEEPSEDTLNSYRLNHKLYNSLILTQILEQPTHNTSEIKLAQQYQVAGMNQLEIGNIDSSLELLLKSKQILQESAAGESETLALLLEQISFAYNKQGQFELGLQYALQSLEEINKIHYEENHESVAKCLHRVSTSYQLQKNAEETFNYAQRALMMRRAIYSNQSNEFLADSLDQMSNSYYLLGNLNQSLNFCSQSLKMMQSVYNYTHPKVSLSLNNMGCIYYQLQDYDNSIKYFYQGLEIAYQLYSQPHHPIITEYMQNIQIVLGQVKNSELISKIKNDIQIIKNKFDMQAF